MPALPTTKDVRRVRKQAEAGVTVTFGAVKSPLFAVLGAVDAASQTVQNAYSSFVERGEEVFDELRSQPRIKHALDSVESGVDTAQKRLEVVVRDVNVAATDLRARFARTSRSVGEKAARGTERFTTVAAQHVQEAADDISEAVTEAGDEAAASTRSVTRRAANQASPPREPATRRIGGNNTQQP